MMEGGKAMEQQILSNHLTMVLIDVDLQLYKGSIYKLRWGSPGGLDEAIPCYRAAKRTISEAPWPDEMRDLADELTARVDRYISILESRDVTSASAQLSALMSNFKVLQERVRDWRGGVVAGRRR